MLSRADACAFLTLTSFSAAVDSCKVGGGEEEEEEEEGVVT